jgi:uncharacterized membrane protein
MGHGHGARAEASCTMAAVLSRIRPVLEHLADKADTYVPRVTAALGLALWPVSYGIAIGAAAFAWTHPALRGALDENKVPETPQLGSLGMLAWTAAGLALVAAIHVWAIARLPAPRRESIGPTLTSCRERLRPSLALPIFAAFAGPGVESDGPATILALAALAAIAVAATVYRWPAGRAWAAAPMALLRPAAPALALAVMGAFVAWLGRLTTIDYQALHPHTIDLGLYDNIVWHTAHGDWLGSSFLKGGHHGSAHFDPILIAIAPLYALRPRADTLLLLQVLWVSTGIVPLYLLARTKLGNPLYGVAFAAMYAAHPAVQGAALYEFHSLTLVGPLLIWLVYLLERGFYRAYAALLVPVLLCREDVSLLVCFVALYAILRGGRQRVRAGWVTILASATYFVVVKRCFMDSPDLLNSGPASYGFAYYYADLIPNGNGAKGIAVSLLTNPGFVLRNVLVRPKLEFAAELLLPLGLLPLAARPARTMLIYGAIFCLLASKPAVYSIAFQYSTVILPLAFVAAVIALEQLPDWRIVAAHGLDAARLRRALIALSLTASALVSWKLGALDPHHVFYAGFTPIAHDLDDAAREQYAWVDAAIARIPPGASVTSTQRLGPFVSNRRDAYDYASGKPSDYLFLDEGELSLMEDMTHAQEVNRGELEIVTRRQALVLYRRNPTPDAPK